MFVWPLAPVFLAMPLFFLADPIMNPHLPFWRPLSQRMCQLFNRTSSFPARNQLTAGGARSCPQTWEAIWKKQPQIAWRRSWCQRCGGQGMQVEPKILPERCISEHKDTMVLKMPCRFYVIANGVDLRGWFAAQPDHDDWQTDCHG